MGPGFWRYRRQHRLARPLRVRLFRALLGSMFIAALLMGFVVFAWRHTGTRPQGWLVVVGFALALWWASGRVAWRLARPLDDLAQVVRRIGQGDLSARVELKRQGASEIAVMSEAVNDMASRLEKQVDDQRRLLATVSHELRTPLSRMRLLTELLRGRGVKDSAVDELDREVEEIDALVGDLLASSRLDFSALVLKETQARGLAQRALERAGEAPDMLVDRAGEALVSVDSTLVARALANLLSNAKSHGGGLAGLEVTVEDSACTFAALDTGPGLSDTGPSLFERFAQGQGSTADGLGLGLALVKRIAVAHGGAVFAQNRDGGGARVGFSLPLKAGIQVGASPKLG